MGVIGFPGCAGRAQPAAIRMGANQSQPLRM